MSTPIILSKWYGYFLAMDGGSLEPITADHYPAAYWLQHLTRPWDDDGKDYEMNWTSMDLRVYLSNKERLE